VALTTAGAGGEVAGLALDATGVGAIVGVPAGAVSAVAIGLGVTMLAGGVTVASESISNIQTAGSGGGGGSSSVVDGAKAAARAAQDATDKQALDDLAAYRQQQGMPEAGSEVDADTAARLDVNGKSYYGRNAPTGQGRPVTLKPLNAVTRDHAEGDVLQQAFDGGQKADQATLYVDRPFCPSCGDKGRCWQPDACYGHQQTPRRRAERPIHHRRDRPAIYTTASPPYRISLPRRLLGISLIASAEGHSNFVLCPSAEANPPGRELAERVRLNCE